MADDAGIAVYALSLTGVGMDVNMEIDRATALRVVGVLLGDTDPPVPPVSPSSSGARATPISTTDDQRSRPRSLREFLDDRDARRKPDQILTIAYFLTELGGAEDFDRDELKASFATAREPLPSNFARDFSWTIRNGWISEAHGKPGRFYVTQKGVQAVEAKFSRDIKKATSSKKGSRRRRESGPDDLFDQDA